MRCSCSDGEGDGSRGAVNADDCVEPAEFGGAKRFDIRRDENEGEVGEAIVVLLPGSFVSSLSEGGGGRLIRRLDAGSTEALQRKHSPVPKYDDEVCGASVK